MSYLFSKCIYDYLWSASFLVSKISKSIGTGLRPHMTSLYPVVYLGKSRNMFSFRVAWIVSAISNVRQLKRFSLRLGWREKRGAAWCWIYLDILDVLTCNITVISWSRCRSDGQTLSKFSKGCRWLRAAPFGCVVFATAGGTRRCFCPSPCASCTSPGCRSQPLRESNSIRRGAVEQRVGTWKCSLLC